MVVLQCLLSLDLEQITSTQKARHHLGTIQKARLHLSPLNKTVIVLMLIVNWNQSIERAFINARVKHQAKKWRATVMIVHLDHSMHL
ncbi:hypothetical protein EMCRGX_G002377 [Ephydatia muelleri]